MIYDLTQTIRNGIPYFPGTGKPFLRPANLFEIDGYRETMYHMTSHTGTHVDAPSHLLKDGADLDAYDISYFCGKALVLDCRGCGGARSITKEFLQPWEEQIRSVQYVLFYTGFEAKWEDYAAYIGDFATPSVEAAEYLVSLGIRGTGTDAISIDPIPDKQLLNHHVLLGAGAVSIASLVLSRLEHGKIYDFCALPLKYEHSDGAPLRAIAAD